MTRSPARLRKVRHSLRSAKAEPADRRPTARRRLTRWGGGVAVVAVLAAAGCGISDSSDDGGGALSGKAGPADFSSQDGGLAASIPAGGSAASGVDPSARRPSDGLDLDTVSLDRAQIKKAQIALTSDEVATVVTRIEALTAAQGGFIDSENTATDPRGIAQSSVLTLRVPVDTFSTTVDQVSRMGRLESKKTTTEDVTGEVADVASRVSSAKESIAQLRVLFSHATKLGDIITLESELSARESDLEALEAQQRVLTAQTSLSTISVSVSRPPTAATQAASDDDSAGFLGGLRQGWDALVTAFEGTAHALGAALPIGLTLTALGLLGWAAVRRLPRRRESTSG